MIGSAIVFVSGLAILLSQGGINAGMAGLMLSYALTFSDALLVRIQIIILSIRNVI